jgi:chloride channel protein, CIC family
MTAASSSEITPCARRAGGWLRESRAGLFVIAVIVGVGGGLGAVAFRYLIYFFTWLATGHSQFGQAGHAGSSHLPWLGPAFFVVIPVIGGLIYGPLIYRYAREARGHGVPEVMLAVAENGGRIRPQVSVVKALASALCIGTGGSVGREGPIVQIGSALASSFGQRVRMPENRMRILVACGAGAGIAATFNAPITGVFFGVEIILREFSIDAMFTVMLSAMIADAVAIPFLGDKPFLRGFPPGIALVHPGDYLLIALLAVVAGLIGLLFKKVVYKMEDLWDVLWKNRPEWARPTVGGIALGLLLLALPQMYGVGYPVMYKAVAGNYVLWFLLVLAAGKILACSLTLGIGGSGGVFAPSLFVGVTSGMAFGEFASHVLGPAAGDPALYAVVAMGAVFTSAARAPLTSVASVVEMTGDYALTLPVMLAVAIATASSRALSYGTIYTTKLLRRGYDVDRAAPWRAFGDLNAADAMRPFATPLAVPPDKHQDEGNPAAGGLVQLPGQLTYRGDPPVVYGSESLAQTLRQLDAYGRDGLPVLSGDGQHVQGWITNASVLRAVATELGGLRPKRAEAPAALGGARSGQSVPRPTTPVPPAALPGYQVLEVYLSADSPAAGRFLSTVGWPPGSVPVSVLRDRSLAEPDPDFPLEPGDRVALLTPTDVTWLPRGDGEAGGDSAPQVSATHPRFMQPSITKRYKAGDTPTRSHETSSTGE